MTVGPQRGLYVHRTPPNQPLQQTAAATLDPRDIKAHGAAAAAELFRSGGELRSDRPKRRTVGLRASVGSTEAALR